MDKFNNSSIRHSPDEDDVLPRKVKVEDVGKATFAAKDKVSGGEVRSASIRIVYCLVTI